MRQAWWGRSARYAVGQLSRDAVARHIGSRIGVTATTITLDHPNAAHDVDKAADLAFAERKLRERAEPT